MALEKQAKSQHIYKNFDTPLSVGLKKNSKKFKEHINKYIDMNSTVLTSSLFEERLYMNDKDIGIIYEVTNTTPEAIREIVKEYNLTDGISKDIFSRDLLWIYPLIVRYYMKAKDDEGLKASILYITFLIYILLYAKYFKYTPSKEIMAYTVNNLSNKYYIKQYGTLIRSLLEVAMNNHEAYKDTLNNPSDADVINYINNLRIRLNNFMKNIASEFYENQKNTNYLNSDVADLDNGIDTTNVSLNLENIKESTFNHIVSNKPNRNIILLSAGANKVSTTELERLISRINNEDPEGVKSLISAILSNFIAGQGHSAEYIKSPVFVSNALNLFTQSNSVNPDVVKAKSILAKWQDQYLSRYGNTQKMSFRKAIFLYYVFIIQDSK